MKLILITFQWEQNHCRIREHPEPPRLRSIFAYLEFSLNANSNINKKTCKTYFGNTVVDRFWIAELNPIRIVDRAWGCTLISFETSSFPPSLLPSFPSIVITSWFLRRRLLIHVRFFSRSFLRLLLLLYGKQLRLFFHLNSNSKLKFIDLQILGLSFRPFISAVYCDRYLAAKS